MLQAPRDRVHIPEVLEPDERLPPDLLALRKFSDLMDRAVPIPGTNQRFGLDAAAGLIPGVGDVVTGAMSAWVIITAIRHRVPAGKLFRMFFNVTIDVLIGAIPLLGDVFDVLHKQHVMNLKILMESRNRNLPPRRKREIVAAMFFVIIVITAIALGALTATVAMIYWIAQLRLS